MALAITDSTPSPAAASSLAPGFRFHPTDEELVRYYLRRKVCGKPFRFDAISDVDVYKVEPWDLPGLSKLKSRDLEWYFFSVLDKKYGNGSRTNRATVKGYWKTTGKDRVVHHRSQQVGMKKTLVYHNGRAPKGERTNWVMHEYRLIDQELQKAGIVQDAFVLCRIFQKSGTGPKNGEKYGAPFIEEEWENDEYAFVPQLEDHTEGLAVDKDSYLDANDIEQILKTGLPREDDSLLFTNGSDVSAEVTDGPQKSLVFADGYESQVVKSDGSQLFDPSVQTEVHAGSVSQGYIGESSNTMDFGMDFLRDEPYFDATDIDFQLDDSLFFQADDFKNAVDRDSGLDMLNEYTTLFNPDVDNFQYTFDSVENNTLPDSMLNLENMNKGTHQLYESSQPVEGQNVKIAAASKKENPVQEADIAYPFLKKASYMLGNISAPPALAAEFPTKYMTSASKASSAVNVTFSDVFFKEGVVDLPLGKHTQVNIVVSFGPGQRDISAYQSEKVVNAGAPRGWFYSSFLWILVLCFSFKIGCLVCSKSFMS